MRDARYGTDHRPGRGWTVGPPVASTSKYGSESIPFRLSDPATKMTKTQGSRIKAQGPRIPGGTMEQWTMRPNLVSERVHEGVQLLLSTHISHLTSHEHVHMYGLWM